MPLTFDSIADADDGRNDAGPSAALSGLGRSNTSRRRFLRYASFAGLGLGAAALASAPLGWGPFRSGRAIAETDPRRGYGEFITTGPGCTVYGPYGEMNDYAGAYTVYAAACHGFPISHGWCRWGWHRNPINTACFAQGKTRNAWRWRTPDGRTYRCSDGYDADGDPFICRQRVE